ncbi:hypothetical protein BS17DRAFT_765186 [Gyrodon lividus]|nr:hypothetical protein BS17DRAFT_765186 [Gyrodon lividus]
MGNASIRNYQDRNFQTVNYKIRGCSLPQIYQDGEFLNNEKTTDDVKVHIESNTYEIVDRELKMYELDMVSSSCILMVPSMTQEAASLMSLGWGIPKQAQYHAGEFPYQRYINIVNSHMATILCLGIPRWQQHDAGEFPDSNNIVPGNSLTVTIW